MKALKVFILGLLYGWLVKFLLDRIYQDHRGVRVTRENVLLRERVRSLEAQLQSQSLESQPGVQTAVQTRPIQRGKKKDDLKLLKGIGPATEKKLNDAGIYTFADLAQLTKEKLRDILGSSKRAIQSAGNLISEAKELAEQ